MRGLLIIFVIFFSTNAKALALDFGAGYSVLDLKNPNETTSRSTGLGLALGGYYSLYSNSYFDLGLKTSGFYAQLKNDMSNDFLQEETQHYNLGAGVELTMYNFFMSWQRKYNRLEVELNGNVQNTTSFSQYMSQWELGYELPMETMAVRFTYQYIKGTLPQWETGLSSDSDFTSSSFMVILRFNLYSHQRATQTSYDDWRSSSSKNSEDTKSWETKKEDYLPGYRSYRYSPKPSTQVKYN